MLRAEAEQVRAMATEIAKRAVQGQTDPIIKQIDKLATRIAALEKAAQLSALEKAAQPEVKKGKTNAKL
jgi:hypothetical protein